MAHVPEGRRVFAQLSVLENLKLGAYTRKDKDGIKEDLLKIYERFPRLEERKKAKRNLIEPTQFRNCSH